MPHREDEKTKKKPQRRRQTPNQFSNPFLTKSATDFVTPAAASNFAAPGLTTLGGANSISGLGGGISGASVTGGSTGAGLGGTSAALGAGAGASVLAWPLAIPAIGAALNDGGNERSMLEAMRDIKEGKAERAPLDLRITRRGGAEFVGGHPNAVDRAIEFAAERGIGATKINPVLATFNANRENLKKHLEFVAGQPDRFKGEKNRSTARAAANARKQGSQVTQANVTNNVGGVRHAFKPENIARRRTQGGR